MAHTTTSWTTGDAITEAKLDNDAAQYDHLVTDIGAGSVPVAATALTGSVATARLPNATKTLWLSASGAVPRTTGGCAALAQTELATNKQNILTLDFDTATDEYAVWPAFAMPDGYNGGTLSILPYWTAASGSGTVCWAIEGRSYANDEALDVAWGTAATSTDTLITANDVHVGPAATLTLGGTPAGGELVLIEIYRDVSADTLGVDAKLIGLKIEITQAYTD